MALLSLTCSHSPDPMALLSFTCSLSPDPVASSLLHSHSLSKKQKKPATKIITQKKTRPPFFLKTFQSKIYSYVIFLCTKKLTTIPNRKPIVDGGGEVVWRGGLAAGDIDEKIVRERERDL